MLNSFSNRVAVWYHPISGLTSNQKPDNVEQYIYFPSTSEFRCFKVLRKHLKQPDFTLAVHHKLTVLKTSWEVDFMVVAQNKYAKDKLTYIASTLNTCTFNEPLSRLYIEYKGKQDPNFRRKFTHFLTGNSILCKRIILVSDNPSSFVLENHKNLTRLTHPICSVEYMRSVILASENIEGI